MKNSTYQTSQVEEKSSSRQKAALSLKLIDRVYYIALKFK